MSQMGLINGIRYNLKGLIFAFKNPKLMVLGLLRFTILLILTIACIGLVLIWHDEVLNLIWQMPEQGIWLWLWKILSWIVFLLLSIVSMLAAYIVSQVFFCVFIMDYMSRVTEAMVLGRKIEAVQGSWVEFGIYLIRQELPRAIIPVTISFLVLGVSLVTPLGPVMIVVSSLCAGVFLAWDNTDLIPARRMYPFNKRFDMLKKDLFFHIGFGLWFLVPWLNIIFLSFAPVGATLYFIDRESVQER